MSRLFGTGLAVLAPLLLLPAAAMAATASPIAVSGGWARATLPGQPVAAAYLTIINRSARADRLLGARSPRARSVTLHRSAVSGGVMRMRALTSGLTLAPRQQARLAPGSLHLMLSGLGSPLRPGQRVPLLLRFERAGEVAATLLVKPAATSAAVHHAH